MKLRNIFFALSAFLCLEHSSYVLAQNAHHVKHPFWTSLDHQFKKSLRIKARSSSESLVACGDLWKTLDTIDIKNKEASLELEKQWSVFGYDIRGALDNLRTCLSESGKQGRHQDLAEAFKNISTKGQQIVRNHWDLFYQLASYSNPSLSSAYWYHAGGFSERGFSSLAILEYSRSFIKQNDPQLMKLDEIDLVKRLLLHPCYKGLFPKIVTPNGLNDESERKFSTEINQTIYPTLSSKEASKEAHRCFASSLKQEENYFNLLLRIEALIYSKECQKNGKTFLEDSHFVEKEEGPHGKIPYAKVHGIGAVFGDDIKRNLFPLEIVLHDALRGIRYPRFSISLLPDEKFKPNLVCEKLWNAFDL